MKLVFGARHLKFASLVLKPQSGPEQDTEWKHDTFKMNSAQEQTLSSQA
jgi:hypothetical protein